MSKQKPSQNLKRHHDPQGAALRRKLRDFDKQRRPLPGIHDPAALECLVKQLVDSVRRVVFVQRLAGIQLHADCADSASTRFDPLRAAVLRSRQGDPEDAVWLVFLAVHFGKHKKDGWALVRLVYGRTGEQGVWDWRSVSANPADFRRWLGEQNSVLSKCRFSNHRQYESLSPHSVNGTGSIVEGFVRWITTASSFNNLVRSIHQRSGQHPTVTFDALYKEMDAVPRFGRLGRFDFLTMLGKLGLAPISPGSAYIWHGATGPYRGIRLLATGNTHGLLKRRDADQLYVNLGQYLGLGMQELEDALCNWQKSPSAYEYFRG